MENSASAAVTRLTGETFDFDGLLKRRRPGHIQEKRCPPTTELEFLSEISDTLRELLLKQDLILGHLTTQKPQGLLYNTGLLAVSIATPTKPAQPNIIANATTGQTGYDRIQIFELLGRNSPGISVINDGNASIYVISSNNGEHWTDENPILKGEARIFYDVYELRIRCTVAGNTNTLQGGVYRLTEYDYSLAYTSTVTFNSTAFTVRSLQGIALPAAGGTQLPDIPIPNGFALVIKATPGNAGLVYYAINSANTNVATLRGTLAAGDSVSLYISNANLVWVAGSIAGQNVDITVEQ